MLVASRSPARPPRVAIVHDGFVPRYRVALFERLAHSAAAEYVVYHGDPPPERATVAAQGPFAFPNVRVRSRRLRVGSRSVVHQHLVADVLRGRYDAFILGAGLRYTSTAALHPIAHLTGRPVIVWGQGAWKEEDVGRIAGAVTKASARLQRRIARTADAYLVYTDGRARRLAACGLDPDRIFVARNTIDVDEQVRLHAEAATLDEARLRRDLGLRPDSVVLLYLGRVYRAKRVPELLDVVRSIRGSGRAGVPLEVVIVGDGPDLPRVRARAAGLDDVHVVGALDDQTVIARWMRVSAAVVIPGAVGLAINHAFAHGLPLVTRASRLHGPEIEYLRHGVNGLMVEGDLEAFATTLAELAASPERRARLATAALQTRENLRLDTMVAAFDAAVARVL